MSDRQDMAPIFNYLFDHAHNTNTGGFDGKAMVAYQHKHVWHSLDALVQSVMYNLQAT